MRHIKANIAQQVPVDSLSKIPPVKRSLGPVRMRTRRSASSAPRDQAILFVMWMIKDLDASRARKRVCSVHFNNAKCRQLAERRVERCVHAMMGSRKIERGARFLDEAR